MIVSEQPIKLREDKISQSNNKKYKELSTKLTVVQQEG